MAKAIKHYKVSGMDCASCAMVIETELEDIGVTAKCSFSKEILEVEFDQKKTSESEILKVVESGGYHLAKTD